MDNFQFFCRDEIGNTKNLARALAVVFSHAPGLKATHYRVREVPVSDYCEECGHRQPQDQLSRVRKELKGSLQLVLLWHEEQPCLALPFPLTESNAPEFVSNWLATIDDKQRIGQYPDGEVDNSKAWAIDVGTWGHGGGSHYGICAITPCWAWHGK